MWNFTWLICPVTVLSPIIFSLLYWVSRKSGSTRYFWGALIGTVLSLLVLTLYLLIIGPSLIPVLGLLWVPSIIVAYSFIRAYREV